MFDEQRKASQDQFAFLVRILVLGLAGLFVLAFIASRVFYLTTVRGEKLLALSQSNFERGEKIPAPRGDIFDRRGRLLATSEPRHNLSLRSFQVPAAQMRETLEKLERHLPKAKIPELRKIMATRDQIPIASELTSKETLPLMEQQSFLPGLRVDQTYTRVYPRGRSAAFLTGYVSKLSNAKESKEDLALLKQGYSLEDHVGRQALEKKYESFLRGQKGTRSVWRDAHGVMLRSDVEANAQRGADLTLTVDIDFQEAIYRILKDRPGVVVVMDPRNGETLALVSNPSYDPNNPASSILPGNSEFNKALQSRGSPGSVFKLVTATAFLLNGGDPERRYTCEGTGENMGLKNRKYMRCDQSVSHGPTNLKRAITVSCNMYFFDVAEKVGLQDILKTGRVFGFGTPTGITLMARGETGGLLGNKSGNEAELKVNQADIHMLAIGQGRLLQTTPMQVINSYCALANGGNLYIPRILKRVEFPHGEAAGDYDKPVVSSTIPWNSEQRQSLMQGFIGVVSDPKGGTGRHANFAPEMKVAGKTGTAERETAEGRVTDAGFVGFAPYDNPEVCLYVMMEAAGHGGQEAAPVAKEVLEEYYRIKARNGGRF